MQRKNAFMLAGLLTATVTTILISMTGLAGAAATPDRKVQPLAVEAGAAADHSSAADAEYLSKLQAGLVEREQALQAQLDQGKAALTGLDATAQPQIEALQTQLAGVESATAASLQELQARQAQVTQVQAAIAQDGHTFQAELARLQAAETQLRQQLEATAAQLQAAYGAITARQAAKVDCSSSDGSNQNFDDNPEQYEHEGDGHECHEDEGNND